MLIFHNNHFTSICFIYESYINYLKGVVIMGLRQDIYNKVKDIVDTKFEVTDITYVPDINDSKLTFGNTGLQFEATVLYIDMRGSTEILNKHNNPTVAKIHMSYFHTIVKIASSLGGDVRSFNGDSMLVFFQGTTKATLCNAVIAAMQITYMLTNKENGINNLLEKYTPINFGIGIDDGKILSTKIGVGGDSNKKDLIWIGNAVNKSVVISDARQSPYYIGISNYVYSNLTDPAKYSIQKNIWGTNTKVDMWTPSSITYNNTWEQCYYTSYYWSVS